MIMTKNTRNGKGRRLRTAPSRRKVMKSTELLAAVVIATLAIGGPLSAAQVAKETGAKETGGKEAKAPAPGAATRFERWKMFREHLEKLGKKELLPEEEPGAKAPATDAIIGVLFRTSPEIAAAHDLLEQE